MHSTGSSPVGPLAKITLVSLLGGAIALSCCKSETSTPDGGGTGSGATEEQSTGSQPPKKDAPPMSTDDSVVKRDDLPTTEEEWRAHLEETLAEPSDTDLAYRVTREKGTERAFSGRYWNEKRSGDYRCRCCNQRLFDSETKFDSGTGWPSFSAPVAERNVTEERDSSHGMVRTEVLCSNCGAHLGHVFPDGPQPTGQRYCINSISLKLDPRQ